MLATEHREIERQGFVPSETTEGGRLTKIDRYKWVSRNQQGELAYVSKHRLLVDDRYQRALNDAKRLRIASKWNWAACGVLLVARRKDGRLYVIDGQHRWAAAMSRADITDLPVAIFDLSGSIEDEATDFLIANKERKPLTGVESFKAQIATGDEIARAAQDLIQKAGREVTAASNARSVACVGFMQRAMTLDRPAFERIWPLICELSEGMHIDNRLMAGLFTLERRMVDHLGQPRSLSDRRIAQRLSDLGGPAVLRAIAEASAYYKRGGEQVFAQGCLNLINYKRVNRFALRGFKSDQ